jgi:hypothetical protein
MIEALNWHPDFSTPTTSMSLARKIDEIISKVNELEAKLQCASPTNSESAPCDCCGAPSSFHQCRSCAKEYDIVK